MARIEGEIKMNKLFAEIDSAAARAQAFEHVPVTQVPLDIIREQIRQAEIDIAESTMRRDALRLILDLREQEELNRTRKIIAKIYQ
jgi:hypothetical protein